MSDQPPPSGLDDIAASIEAPDRAAAQAATERWDSLTKPQGALGRLESLGTWWASVRGECPPPGPARPKTSASATKAHRGCPCWPRPPPG